MNRTLTILVIMTTIIIAGCQQSQQSKSGAEKKERLIAAENMSLKAEVANLKNEIDNQSKLVEQYRQKINELTAKGVADANMIKRQRGFASQYMQEAAELKKQLEECQRKVNLTDVPELCKYKVEMIQAQLDKCKKEKDEIEKGANESITFLMEQLPQELMKEVQQLNEENTQLKAKIEQLEKD